MSGSQRLLSFETREDARRVFGGCLNETVYGKR
jgi:hypothetical protein